MGIQRIGIAARQLFTRGNTGTQIGGKGKALLNEFTHLVGKETSNPKDYAELMEHYLKEGRMPNFNMYTGEHIEYSKKFLKLWNQRQKLLTDFTKLVGKETNNPKDWAEALEHYLKEGRMANFNAYTGEKIKYPKSFVKQFQAYQA